MFVDIIKEFKKFKKRANIMLFVFLYKYRINVIATIYFKNDS